jgi:hypothetical protein
MTFIVGSDDIVLQKDLGDRTAELGKAMIAYDPDETWTLARETPAALVQRSQPR